MRSIGSPRDNLTPQLSLAALCNGSVPPCIEEAIHATQPTHQRRRSPLDPLRVFWLCLALPLFRTRSIPNVLAVLRSQSRGRRFLSLRPVTDGALAHARKRLGPEPLRRFFERQAAELKVPASFHGRRVWALDATVLSVADTPANEAGFGRHRPACGRSGFPQLRLVTLSCVRTHQVRAASWVPCQVSEQVAAQPVLEHLRPGDLVLMDRGFRGAWLYASLKERGIDFVARLYGRAKPRRRGQRGPGDQDVELRGTRPQDLREGLRVDLRMIEYRVRGGREPVRLVTSLEDPAITAREIAVLYRERWEIELGFDEIKTHLLGVRHGTLHLPFRGRTPALVEQELWATLATYNLVRQSMAAAAQRAGIDARRISFTDALVVLDCSLTPDGDPLVQLRRLRWDLAECTLDRWRRGRRAPRAVRRKIGPYPYKRPGDRTQPWAPEIELGWAG